jgi:hypothetical protein
VAVDGLDGVAGGLELGSEAIGGLLSGDAVGLAVAVAVEDGEDVGELAIDDVVEGLRDLAFAGLAITDDAVDQAANLVESGGLSEAGGDGEPLPERAGGGVEEGEALHGVWMAVELGVHGPERLGIVAGEGAAVLGVLADHDAQLAGGGVDDGDGVSLAEDEAVAGGVVGVLGAPPHRVEHEHGGDVGEGECGCGVPAACGSGHLQGELSEINGLCVYSGFE